MREVNISRNLVAIIDNADWAIVSRHCWQAHPVTVAERNWYAKTTANGRTIYMHRLILGARPGEEIDHVNANGLDNRRKNLRRCTRSQNNVNIHKKGGRTGFRGVDFHNDSNRKKKFRGRVGVNGKTIKGAYRETADEAARDYDQIALAEYGEFAILNFSQVAE